MWKELGISAGTAVIVLIALYCVIKWAVQNGIEAAYKDIKRAVRAGIREANEENARQMTQDKANENISAPNQPRDRQE